MLSWCPSLSLLSLCSLRSLRSPLAAGTLSLTLLDSVQTCGDFVPRPYQRTQASSGLPFTMLRIVGAYFTSTAVNSNKKAPSQGTLVKGGAFRYQ